MTLRNLSKEFIQYCEGNELEKVKACLTLGVDVNTVSKDKYGTTTYSGLTIAANKNYPELVDLLLSRPDINVNLKTGVAKTVYQFTAAQWASGRGHTECVRVLAEKGNVNWNIGNNSGWSSLYIALSKRHSDVVDIIVQQQNIDYNVRDDQGCTLGHAAVYGGNKKCVETLANQERFDSWNVPDNNGDTPLIGAIEDGSNQDIMRILLKCPRVDVKSPRVDLNIKDNHVSSLMKIAR